MIPRKDLLSAIRGTAETGVVIKTAAEVNVAMSRVSVSIPSLAPATVTQHLCMRLDAELGRRYSLDHAM